MSATTGYDLDRGRGTGHHGWRTPHPHRARCLRVVYTAICPEVLGATLPVLVESDKDWTTRAVWPGITEPPRNPENLLGGLYVEHITTIRSAEMKRGNPNSMKRIRGPGCEKGSA